ncbi:cell division cycle-associated protein 3-like [Ptychodera flava]|uniref:cell division cycle-associated protein 3-like n=1 Tax=Ptychodera flava TaxID=63121 RepID=UPI00396A9B6E
MGGKESKPESSEETSKPATPIVHRRILQEETVDPRSPSCGIDRTPIQIVKNKVVLDPRSPTADIIRTPIVVDKTWQKVTVAEIQKQIEEFEKENDVSEVNLNNTPCSESPDKTSTSNKEQIVVEVLERAAVNTAESPDESKTDNQDSTGATVNTAKDTSVENINEESVFPSVEEENEDEFVPDAEEIAPEPIIAMGGLELINTPEYEKELSEMKQRPLPLSVDLSKENTAVMNLSADHTSSALRRKPKRTSDNIKPVNRCIAMTSSPQRSPLAVVNIASSPKVLWQKKASTNIPLQRTPQNQVKNKRSSAGNTPARMIDLLVDKENM